MGVDFWGGFWCGVVLVSMLWVITLRPKSDKTGHDSLDDIPMTPFLSRGVLDKNCRTVYGKDRKAPRVLKKLGKK